MTRNVTLCLCKIRNCILYADVTGGGGGGEWGGQGVQSQILKKKIEQNNLS